MAIPDRETPEPPPEPLPEPMPPEPLPPEAPVDRLPPERPEAPAALPVAPPIDTRVAVASGDAGTSGLAVATLIVGLLGGVPLALILGFVALSRIDPTRQRGRGLAITGLVASACWVVLLIAVMAGALVTGGSTAAAPPAATPSGSVSVTSLRIGDCLQYPADPSRVAAVRTMPCEQQHNAEVIGRFDIPGPDWPGVDAVRRAASQGCEDILNQRVNRFALDPGTMLAYFYPSGQPGWQAGDRSVTCLVHQPNGAMQGRVETSSPAA